MPQVIQGLMQRGDSDLDAQEEVTGWALEGVDTGRV